MSPLSKEVSQALKYAKKLGATEADVVFDFGKESSCKVRDGQVEDVTEAISKGLGIRVIRQKKLGFAYTSDTTKAGIERAVEQAVSLSKLTAPHPSNRLPRKDALKVKPIAGLFDPAVAQLSPRWKIDLALQVEEAGKRTAGLRTFESVGAGDSTFERHFASSNGTTFAEEGSSVYAYAVAVAERDGQLQNGSFVDVSRQLSRLDSAEKIGQEAARRAVAMLGARKGPTKQVPVIFNADVASGFISSIAAAANGDAVHKKSSFLSGQLGKRIASPKFTLIDDGRLDAGLGSSLFDGEGVPTRTTRIIDGGKLGAYLYDTQTALKAKAKSTGNAARSYKSLPRIGTHNLYAVPGDKSLEAMIAGIDDGLLVTALLGHGVNIVTGEFSRGANGFWIRHGEIAEPIQEVTVAGKLSFMLNDIQCIGSDLRFRGSAASPSIQFGSLTVSGE